MHTASLMQSVTCTNSELDLLCTVLPEENTECFESPRPQLRMTFQTNQPATILESDNEITEDIASSTASDNDNAPLGYNDSSACTLSDFPSCDSFASDDEFESEDECDLPFSMLLQLISQTDEDIILAEHGYAECHKLCDTLQGELLKAQIIRPTESHRGLRKGDFVAIKKIEKILQRKHEAMRSGEMMYFVEEDIVKESAILKHLNMDSSNVRDIARFVEFFESGSYLYLVTEYIDGVTLQRLITRAHDHIRSGKLLRSHWANAVRQIMWQIVMTINYLHSYYHCCHLDLCADNVMVQGITFNQHPNGRVTIEGSVKVILVDFGVAEIFDAPTTLPSRLHSKCMKGGLNLSNEFQQCPESLLGDVYDAAAADMWSIGMLLFRAMVGHPLFSRLDDDGYAAVQRGKLTKYLKKRKLHRIFDSESLGLLRGLLDIDPESRMKAPAAERHVWFRLIRQIHRRKQKSKALWLDEQQRKLFPFYQELK